MVESSDGNHLEISTELVQVKTNKVPAMRKDKSKEGSKKDHLYDSDRSSEGENYEDDFDEGEVEDSPIEHASPDHR